MYRIKHIPTGRFLKKRSSIGFSIDIARGYSEYGMTINDATTRGVGHIYATWKGAFNALNDIQTDNPNANDWVIIEN